MSCILSHWGVQLILAYSWARLAVLVAGKIRGGMFLFLLFLSFHSCSFLSPLLSLFSLSLGDDTKWPARVDMLLNPNTINQSSMRLYLLNSWIDSVRGHPRGRLGRKSLPKLDDFSLSWAEGEVKMYRMYREIQNLDRNFSLKSWNCRKTSPSLKALGCPLDSFHTFANITYWSKDFTDACSNLHSYLKIKVMDLEILHLFWLAVAMESTWFGLFLHFPDHSQNQRSDSTGGSMVSGVGWENGPENAKKNCIWKCCLFVSSAEYSCTSQT